MFMAFARNGGDFISYVKANLWHIVLVAYIVLSLVYILYYGLYQAVLVGVYNRAVVDVASKIVQDAQQCQQPVPVVVPGTQVGVNLINTACLQQWAGSGSTAPQQ